MRPSERRSCFQYLVRFIKGETPKVSRDRLGSVLELAEIHRVGSILRSQLMKSQIPLPVDQQRRLAIFHSAWLAKREVLVSTIQEIGRLARSEEVSIILFKGLQLAEKIYSEPENRLFRDIDLLIQAADYRRLTEMLEKSGFQQIPSPYSGLKLKTLLEWELPVSFSPKDKPGIHIDLHLNPFHRLEVFHLPTELFWNDSRPWKYGIQQMSDFGFLLHLFIHSMKHGYLDLLHLYDLILALQNPELQLEFPRVVRSAKEARLTPIIMTELRVIENVFGRISGEGNDLSEDFQSRILSKAVCQSLPTAQPFISERFQILLLHFFLTESWEKRFRHLRMSLFRPPSTVPDQPYNSGYFTNPWAGLVRLCRRIESEFKYLT